jgi:DNA-binding HxlR family transcriptional regulator
VEYQLTDLGRTLTEPLDALWNWASAHQHDVSIARREYDAIHADASEDHPPERRYAGAVR